MNSKSHGLIKQKKLRSILFCDQNHFSFTRLLSNQTDFLFPAASTRTYNDNKISMRLPTYTTGDNSQRCDFCSNYYIFSPYI